jgi:cytochrome c-type biogenesis protein CcmH
MRWVRILVVTLAFAAPLQALAVQPDEVLIDTALEARARALSKELRCMVCQNQSIDDSDAPLARDLRILVRERLKAGDSDAQVLDFLVARYGEFVLLKPRLSGHTALLWGMPVAALLLGTIALLVAWRRYRKRAKAVIEAAPLTPSEEARVAGILQRSDG